MGFINKEPVAFVAVNKFPHPTNKNIFKIGRIVVLPHWQGYNIGMKMVEEIAKEYEGCDLRLTTTLPIVHSYLYKRKDKWALRFQGIRKAEDAGSKASMSKAPRECYLETYQYRNSALVDTSISRTRCPINKIKS